jgi:hypothetical protein
MGMKAKAFKEGASLAGVAKKRIADWAGSARPAAKRVAAPAPAKAGLTLKQAGAGGAGFVAATAAYDKLKPKKKK